MITTTPPRRMLSMDMDIQCVSGAQFASVVEMTLPQDTSIYLSSVSVEVSEEYSIPNLQICPF